MSHEVESAVFADGKPAWHHLGNVVAQERLTGEEARKLGGLDWQVAKIPMFGVATLPSGDELEVDFSNMRAGVIRLDRLAEGKPCALGVVGPDYSLVQNEELFDFVEALQDTGDAQFYTAGSLKGGRVVWATARLGAEVRIAGMEDEKIDPFIAAINAHDGTRALTTITTPVRIVCQNTMNLAISKAIRVWSVRHTSGIQERIQEAREALGISFKYLEQFEKVGNALVRSKMTQAEFKAFLTQLIPYTPEMIEAMELGQDSRAAKNVDEAREAIRNLYVNSPNLQNVKGTKWAAVNATAEYVDFVKTQRTILEADGKTPDERAMAERRFVRTLIDNTMKQRALRLLDPKLAHQKGENLEVLTASALS